MATVSYRLFLAVMMSSKTLTSRKVVLCWRLKHLKPEVNTRYRHRTYSENLLLRHRHSRHYFRDKNDPKDERTLRFIIIMMCICRNKTMVNWPAECQNADDFGLTMGRKRKGRVPWWIFCFVKILRIRNFAISLFSRAFVFSQSRYQEHFLVLNYSSIVYVLFPFQYVSVMTTCGNETL